MKILYDHQIFYMQKFGGVSRYFMELYKNINSTENPITVSIQYNCNYYIHEILGRKIIPVMDEKMDFWSRVKRKKYLWFYPKVNRKKSIAAARKADVVHLTWNEPYMNDVCKDKLVVTIHDMIHEIYWPTSAQTQIKWKKRAIYDSKAIIAISENTKRDILKFYPDIPEEKIHVIYHGTNHLPEPEKPAGFAVPAKYILFVGRREDDYKGAAFATKALAKTLLKYNMQFVFVGGNEFAPEEIMLFETLGITNNVMQVSVTDAELAYMYSHAECFVYPSLYEGFGFPILEAMDNNCPVVCTNSSSLPEVGGDAALYFDGGDAEKLNEHVCKLIEDADYRQNFICKGRDRVKLFTWEKCARETLEVYSSVCKKMA